MALCGRNVKLGAVLCNNNKNGSTRCCGGNESRLSIVKNWCIYFKLKKNSSIPLDRSIISTFSRFKKLRKVLSILKDGCQDFCSIFMSICLIHVTWTTLRPFKSLFQWLYSHSPHSTDMKRTYRQKPPKESQMHESALPTSTLPRTAQIQRYLQSSDNNNNNFTMQFCI